MAFIRCLQAEEMIVALVKAIEADFRSVPAGQRAEGDLRAGILRAAPLLWDHRRVCAAADEVRAVEMIERRDRQQQTRTDRAHPREIHKGIALAFRIALARRLSLS